MKQIGVYPGTFCPPTFGHLEIVKEAADIYHEVFVVCSVNTDKKENWFTPEQCKQLWLAYDSPANVTVLTFSEFVELRIDPDTLVMIRGLRNQEDAEHEKKVMLFNYTRYRIRKFFYIFSKCEYVHCSSSLVRKKVEEFDFVALKELVAPKIITELMQKVKNSKNFYLVVGPPGGGKSTFLKLLHSYNPRVVSILTDEINHQLKSLLWEHFEGQDLEDLVLNNEEELKKFIKKPWFDLLAQAVNSVPDEAHIFVEVAYGMQTDKELWKYLGAKILYVGPVDDYSMLQARVIDRGTPHLVTFIDRIPHFQQTKQLCDQHGLWLDFVNSEGTLAQFEEQAKQFALKLDL